MITIIFPAANTALAAAIGKALTEYAANPRGALPRKASAPTATDFDAAVTGSVSTEAAELLNELELEGEAGQGTVDLDDWRVPFDGAFCARATIPFYASGKDKGQWKKKQGLPKEEYDDWYAEQKATAGEDCASKLGENAGTSAAGGAFGGANAGSTPCGDDPAQTLGTLILWVSEQQNAGKLEAHAVDDAYNRLGYQITDIIGEGALIKRQAVLGILKSVLK